MINDSESWTAVCEERELERGRIFVTQVHGKEVAVVRVGTEVFAINAVCTHALGYLDEGEMDEFEIECPLHGGRFDVRTGEPTCPPADIPLPTYNVCIKDGTIYVEVQRNDNKS